MLPELWSTGYDLENSAAHARINAEIESDIAAWCKSLNLSVGGSMLKKQPFMEFKTHFNFTPLLGNELLNIQKSIYLV